MSWILNVITWPLAYYLDTRHRRGEAKLIHWLENVDASGVLSDLDSALEPLLKDTIEHVDRTFRAHAEHENGRVFWTVNSLRRLLGPHPLLRERVALLWSVFSYAAHYPFKPPGKLESEGRIRIELAAFRRAFAFLVLHGWDLVGERGNDMSFEGYYDQKPERDAHDKAPRIARIINSSLASQEDERLAYDDIKSVLFFVQPPVWRNLCMVPRDFNPYFEAATNRLLQAKDLDVDAKISPSSLTRTNLRSMIQMLLLLRPDNERWREGFSHKWKIGSTQIVTQRAGDVQFFSMVKDNADVADASTHATALMDFRFPSNESSISQEDFQAWCVENVSSVNICTSNRSHQLTHTRSLSSYTPSSLSGPPFSPNPRPRHRRLRPSQHRPRISSASSTPHTFSPKTPTTAGTPMSSISSWTYTTPHPGARNLAPLPRAVSSSANFSNLPGTVSTFSSSRRPTSRLSLLSSVLGLNRPGDRRCGRTTRRIDISGGLL